MDDTIATQLKDAGVADADLPRLSALDGSAQAALAQRLVAAQTAQSAALAEAMDGMLQALPRPLRGPIKKLFR